MPRGSAGWVGGSRRARRDLESVAFSLFSATLAFALQEAGIAGVQDLAQHMAHLCRRVSGSLPIPIPWSPQPEHVRCGARAGDAWEQLAPIRLFPLAPRAGDQGLPVARLLDAGPGAVG